MWGVWVTLMWEGGCGGCGDVYSLWGGGVGLDFLFPITYPLPRVTGLLGVA